jgi:hypothetical protein
MCFVTMGYTHRWWIAPFQGLVGLGFVRVVWWVLCDVFCYDGLHPSLVDCALSGLGWVGLFLVRVVFGMCFVWCVL